MSSSSGDESSSSTSDSDDCIMLSDSEVPPSPEAEDDPNNSGNIFLLWYQPENKQSTLWKMHDNFDIKKVFFFIYSVALESFSRNMRENKHRK